MRKPCTKKDAPARQHGICRKSFYNPKNSDKTTFYTPIEERVMPAPITSKRPEKRKFVVDSGASMHMMSKKELSSEEMGTEKRFRNPAVVLTADEEVHTHEETPAVLSR